MAWGPWLQNEINYNEGGALESLQLQCIMAFAYVIIIKPCRKTELLRFFSSVKQALDIMGVERSVWSGQSRCYQFYASLFVISTQLSQHSFLHSWCCFELSSSRLVSVCCSLLWQICNPAISIFFFLCVISIFRMIDTRPGSMGMFTDRATHPSSLMHDTVVQVNQLAMPHSSYYLTWFVHSSA